MKYQTTTVLKGATILLGVVTFAATAAAGEGDPPKRPKQKPKPITFLSHTNQDQVPPPPTWSHTNQDEMPLPGDPPDPGSGKKTLHPAQPLTGDIIGLVWTGIGSSPSRFPDPLDPGHEGPRRGQKQGLRDPALTLGRPSVLSHDRLLVLDPGPDAFLSMRSPSRFDPALGDPRRDLSLSFDGVSDALDLRLLPPSGSGTAQPFVQSPVPTPGALSLIGLGTLALIGRRRRR